MLSYLALGLAAVIPAVFRRYGKLWLGSGTHPAAVGILAFMACGIVLLVVDSAEVGGWPVAVGWTLAAVGGFVFGERILKAAGVPEPRRAAGASGRSAAPLEGMDPEERREFEAAWPGPMGFGIMLTLTGLPLAYLALMTREFSLMALVVLPLGALMTWSASALKRGEAWAWNAVMALRLAALGLLPAVLFLGETRLWAMEVWNLVRTRPLFRAPPKGRPGVLMNGAGR